MKQSEIIKTMSSEEVKNCQDIMIVDIDGTIISEGIDIQKRHLEKWKQIKKQE